MKHVILSDSKKYLEYQFTNENAFEPTVNVDRKKKVYVVKRTKSDLENFDFIKKHRIANIKHIPMRFSDFAKSDINSFL